MLAQVAVDVTAFSGNGFEVDRLEVFHTHKRSTLWAGNKKDPRKGLVSALGQPNQPQVASVGRQGISML